MAWRQEIVQIPMVYIEALLQLESQRTKQPQLATALHGPRGSLLKRVKLLLGEETITERETMWVARIGVAGVVVLALILGPMMANGLWPIHGTTPSPVGQDLRHRNTLPATVLQAERRAAPETIAHIEDAYRSGIVRVLWGDSETTGFVAKSVNRKGNDCDSHLWQPWALPSGDMEPSVVSGSNTESRRSNIPRNRCA